MPPASYTWPLIPDPLTAGAPGPALFKAASSSKNGDFALFWDTDAFAVDVAIVANDLARDAGLETAVSLSLFTDRRAEDGDVLPAFETDRRGWWADDVAAVEGDRFGSRLWMLARAPATQDTLARAEEYAREALRWLVDDQVAERVEATAVVPRAGILGLLIAIYRPGRADPVRYRYDNVWAAQEA